MKATKMMSVTTCSVTLIFICSYYKNITMNPITWSNVYWFHILIIVILSVAAFGLALAAILTVPSVNLKIRRVSNSGVVTISSLDCNALFYITVSSYNNIDFRFPAASEVGGCSFYFILDGTPSDENTLISLTTATGNFTGLSWFDGEVMNINTNTIHLEPSLFTQLGLISDENNFRITGLSVGVSAA